MQSTVQPLPSIAALPSLLAAGDLLLLDLDETLIKPEFDDASEPWFNAFLASLAENGVEGTNGFFAGIELWQALQAVCDVHPAEGEATCTALAAAAATPGVVCVGLTARGPEMSAETVGQLRHCELFEGVFDTERSLKVLSPSAEGDLVAPLTHLEGIVYCSGPRKPQGLNAFFDKSGCVPQRVVFVDDRESHVRAVCAAMQEKQLPYLGLHYTPGAATSAAKCSLPRGWKLLAAILARERGGRDRLRRMLALLDGEPVAAARSARRDGASSQRWFACSSMAMASAAIVCIAFGAGVALGARCRPTSAGRS